MNGFGVAIASDSAVTMGDRSRTYDTADKIVGLPAPHRIAVLHSGYVEIGNVPYSVLLAEWSRQLPDKPLRTAEAYQRHFIDWLGNNPDWFGEAFQRDLVYEILWERAERIGSVVKESSEIEDFSLEELLGRWIKEVEALPRQNGITSSSAKKLLKNFDEMVTYIIDQNIPAEVLNDETRPRIAEYFAEFLACDYVFKASLVFCGYGEREVLPSWTRADFTGFMDDQLVWSPGDSFEFGADSNPAFSIALPAQRTAIDQYLRGYEYPLIEMIPEAAIKGAHDFLTEALRETDLTDGQQDTVIQLLTKAEEKVSESVWEIVRNYSEENFLSKLRWAIAALPPGSLIDVARSLIEIQALRQTTTAQLNTVGGPIDVALISPDEGFRWVRHKSIG
jgi:hypothetical protein